MNDKIAIPADAEPAGESRSDILRTLQEHTLICLNCQDYKPCPENEAIRAQRTDASGEQTND